jgi:hypothetical protein
VVRAGRSWRIPVAFRLWRPKRSCAPTTYQTKLQLAARMLTEPVAARLPVAYLVMDTHYTAGWFTRLAGRLGICWVGTPQPRTIVVYHGRRQPVAELAGRLRLGWRPRLGLRAAVRLDPSESLAAVKERWQLTITRQGEPPPAPTRPALLGSARSPRSPAIAHQVVSRVRPGAAARRRAGR